MLKTKRIDEEYALQEQELEGLVLKRLAALYKDEERVGELLQITHGQGEFSPGYLLQAELYFSDLPADLFFEKNLVLRKNVSAPLCLRYRPLKGIVLSKDTGVILWAQNHINLRPEWLDDVLECIAYQEKNQEHFAAYISIGNSGVGFLGYDYQPPGPEVKNKKFFHKGAEVDSIKKEQWELVKDDGDVRYEYWNSEKVSRNFPINGDGLEATIGRYNLELTYTLAGSLAGRGGEALHLWHQQIPALKKLIEIYRSYS